MKRIFVMILIMMLLATTIPGVCLAEDEKVYILSGEFDRIKTQLDTGYAYEETLDKNDLHYGWGLGEFYMQGFSKVETEQDGTPVFYKGKDQKLSLGFSLKQDIDKLDGNKDYKISEDINGYDLPFEVPETNFKRGCLIILRFSEDNHVERPKYYTNYLENVRNETANSVIKIDDAGLYRIALDYEITYPGLFGRAYYNNYKIYFEFKVKNTESAAAISAATAGTLWDGISKELLAGLAGVFAVALVAVIIWSIRERKKLREQIKNLKTEKTDLLMLSNPEPKRLGAGKINSDDYDEMKL